MADIRSERFDRPGFRAAEYEAGRAEAQLASEPWPPRTPRIDQGT